MTSTTPTVTARPAYPTAERHPGVEVIHGHTVADPYRWLEDPADERTIAWSLTQQDLFETQARTWPGRERFGARIREMLGAGVVGVPSWRDGRRFFLRREGHQEHGVLVVAEPEPDGASSERVLLDRRSIRV
jgi:prolyl oligopeptidase